MNNFSDFMKVAEEAQKNIELMKAETENVKNEISAINNSRYNRMKNFWLEVGKMLKELNLTNPYETFKTPLPNTTYFKIHVNNIWGKDRIEFGVYDGPDNRFWKGWLFLENTYNEFIIQSGSSSQSSNNAFRKYVVREMADNWDLYEKDFEIAIKEYITEIMANQIRAEEKRYNEAIENLKEISNAK